jgi:peptidoglycan/xylan/chitin deacetylase (PgdA/CDA1 family)
MRSAIGDDPCEDHFVLMLATFVLTAAGSMAGYSSKDAACAIAKNEPPRRAAAALVCEPETTLLEHETREYKRVALTFDACSSGEYRFDREVYDVLDGMQARATIFLGGEWVEKNRRVAHMIAANPLFELATHGYHHPHLRTLPDEKIAWEIQQGQRAVFEELGIFTRLFRAPYGEIDARVLAVAKRVGVTMVQYDLPSGDPDPALKPDKIVRWVVDNVQGGSIVVFHINKNGVHTKETLPKVVSELRAKGFELVTVSELRGEPVTFTDGAYSYDPIVEQQRDTARVALLGKK